MGKMVWILRIAKILMWAIALGIGVWYLSSSLSGAAITYTSMDNFLIQAGVENGDISTANGCFMCRYINDLFIVIGNAALYFWNLILDKIWILIVLGFGLFVLIHTIKYIMDKAKETETLEPKEYDFNFKAWLEPVWNQTLRILLVGLFLGGLGIGGINALETLASLIITPVMYLGAQLGVMATSMADTAQCNALVTMSETLANADTTATGARIIAPIMEPFMCVIGNINTVMLAGATGGFALMNAAWLGMGGGILTWVAGLGLVLMFLIIGFNLFFQILSVVIKLVFLIIFLPIFIAAYAFENTWSKAKGLTNGAINMLVNSAIKLVKISLKALILYATVSYSADRTFPGGQDNYSAILPPMLGQPAENPDAQTQSIMQVFKDCEQAGLVDGQMDADAFMECFQPRKEQVEARYPGAFDFLENGWELIITMTCLFLLYFLIISPRIDKILTGSDNEMFDYGQVIGDLTKTTLKMPLKWADKAIKAVGKK